jgi:hypothetical protein
MVSNHCLISDNELMEKGGLDIVHGEIGYVMKATDPNLTGLDLVLRADNDLSLFGHLTRPTVSKIESSLPFSNSILYAIIHEVIYCQG